MKFLKLTVPTLLLYIYRLRPFWSPCFFLKTTWLSSVVLSADDRDSIFGSLFDIGFGNFYSCYLIYLCFFISEMLLVCIELLSSELANIFINIQAVNKVMDLHVEKLQQ